MVLHFEPETHTYSVAGLVVPSVTQLLKPISPDFSGIPAGVLEAKRILGTVTHEACQYDDEGDLDDESVPEQVALYLSAWRKFKSDTGLVIEMNERQMFHPQLRYAGTVDRVGVINGETWVLDLKTSVEAYPSYGVQLAGYAELIANTAAKRATVQLQKDGSYKLQKFENPADFAAFRACLAIWNWKEANK